MITLREIINTNSHYIGEILVVVFGVLIAFFITNLKEERRRRKRVKSILDIVRLNLITDLKTIDKGFDKLEKLEKSENHKSQKNQKSQKSQACSVTTETGRSLSGPQKPMMNEFLASFLDTYSKSFRASFLDTYSKRSYDE